MTRDESNQSFRPVAKTDAWSDDNGNAHDVLELERIENGTEQCGEREPPMASFQKSMLIGGGPVNVVVRRLSIDKRTLSSIRFRLCIPSLKPSVLPAASVLQ